MARKKKEEQVIEAKVEVTKTNENNENEVTKTNEKVVNKEEEPQKPTKDNENKEQKVTLKGVVIAKGGLRIREEQSLESNIIDVVSYNKEIDILEELEEWVRVEQGYMLKKFVQINK